MNFQKGKFFGEQKGGILDKPYGVLVEGKDDAHLIDYLLENIGADPEFVKIVFCGGKDELASSVRNIVKSRPYITRDLKRFAVIRDCDACPDEASSALNDAFTDAGVPVPLHGQFVAYDGERKVGAFLIPSIDRPGAVEDLLLDIVGNDDTFQSFIPPFESASALAGGLDVRSKRLMQIFLATKSPLCRGGGIALKHGHFDHEHQSLFELKGFLQTLLT